MVQAIQPHTSILPGDMVGQIKPQNLEQAAEQFEAMFLRTLMQQMRKASQALVDDNPFDSKQQRMMRDFYDDKLASQLASQRSSGIAQMIITQLGPQEQAALKNTQSMAALHEHPQHLTPPVVPVMRRGQE
ncbi:rod-binding protein [Scandinavium sp. V105_16]|uniref:Rod-binding protein n=1 Tax=Scandinavium lactucae TaxID=3095028 RepID=A0AAJ2S8N5_9ENTR|nr:MULTISPECIES: rod-binding protein [unclassified Scandinavium]MDX6020080.1 rod-binding protein [Scandinavium sp. V105_16]MDX6032069.1 rod-binding protein [Scandinavium sp. V105_12]MDX6040629.1 rod-binding protein [Scandinavium sp. V105_6]MDX6051533.1 rod-binding protein [Scandinavium sp. V105_1]